MQEFSVMNTAKNDRFLRSINLIYDANSPQNLDHFQPTQKTNKLIKAILGLDPDRAFMVVAPYGSGKSLSAAVSLHLAENRLESQLFLRRLLRKSEAFSERVAHFVVDRLNSGQRGLALALHGHSPSCPSGIKGAAVEALKRLNLLDETRHLKEIDCSSADQFPSFLVELESICKRNDLDRVTIIWDEFGRHLESLVSEGRAENLIDLQVLAEYCSRSRSVPFSFSILLHQVLSRYAHRLPQTAQSEWAKIEGRFTTIQYVDTSKELYRLITEVQDDFSEGTESLGCPDISILEQTSRILQEEGLFTDFSPADLAHLLARAYPIEPVALYLLPRVSARVAQNERTMFTFLYEAELGRAISPESIYDYFSDLMQTDMSVGGTGKAWLEAQSALQKCRGDTQSVKAVKTACLLGLGLSGERSQASLDLLDLALDGYSRGRSKSQITINGLIEKKLLLHRRHTNSVTVWHGTDYDLRGRLDGLMDLRGNSFDWIGFLREYSPPVPWKAVRYYTEFGVKRYFSATFASLEDLKSETTGLLDLRERDRLLDGRIIHVLPKSREEIREASEKARSLLDGSPPRVLISVPSENAEIWNAALEVSCLYEMLNDDQLVSQDPMVPAELGEMINDAQDYLTRLLNRATRPQPGGPRWFYRGTERDIQSPQELRGLLAEILRKEFELTPTINNELIIKHQISKPIANARRKLMSGILNQSGDSMFGLPETEYRTPQASMCRTVLRNTGLYRDDDDGISRFSDPKHVPDPGLRCVWSKISRFYSEPNEESKGFAPLLSTLTEPPYGTRMGVLPLLLCAGYSAFCKEGLLFEGDYFVEELYSTTFEAICDDPQLYSLKVIALNDRVEEYLRQLVHLFSADRKVSVERQHGLLMEANAALRGWVKALPAAAMTTDLVSADTRRLQAILRDIQDPEEIFLTSIPTQLSERRDLEEIPSKLATCVSEMTSVTSRFQDQVAMHLRGHFRKENGHGSKDNTELLARAGTWASLFPNVIRNEKADLMGRKLLEIAMGTYACTGELLDEVAILVVGRPIIQWDSATPIRFRDRFDEIVGRLERQVLLLGVDEIPDQKEVEGVKLIVESRIHELRTKLSQLTLGLET